MVTEDQAVVVILCFVLVWFGGVAQQHSAARAKDAAARRRMAIFCRVQEDKLALVISVARRLLLLIGVWQRRSLWMSLEVRHFSKMLFLDGTNNNGRKT